MFCTQCGTKIQDDARFCPSCGASISDQNPPNSKPVGEAAQPDSPTSNDAEPAAAMTEKTTSLKSAVADTQRRSQRRMPLVALIALALALTSALAFAAYYIYTSMQQQAPEPVQVETQQLDEQQIDQPAEEETPDEASRAVEAYQPVIADYRALATEFRNLSAGDARANGAIDSFIAEHPYTSSALNRFQIDRLDWIRESSTPVFSFVDLNKDGIPECLFGSNSEVNGVLIWEIWSFQNGKPIEIAFGSEKALIELCEDGVISQFINSGAATGTITHYRVADTINLVDISGADAPDGLPLSEKEMRSNLIALSSVSWDGMPNTGIEKVTIADEEGTVTQGDPANWQSERNAVVNNYPADKTAEWKNLLDG